MFEIKEPAPVPPPPYVFEFRAGDGAVLMSAKRGEREFYFHTPDGRRVPVSVLAEAAARIAQETTP